uniref:Uncharacterized protein n=1 Tax=Ditylenchus dipsaci TaxID=166011 RepID=A0A915CT98_9BILA
MLEWIAESNAHPVGDMRLFRLAKELSGVEQWITSAKKIDNVIEYFLGAEPKEFWSTLVHSKKLVELLESCLDFYIRTSYFNELDFYMGLKGGDVHTLFLRIYQRLFLVFLRVLANLKDEGIHDGIFSHLLVYGSENQTILSTLMNKLFVIQVGFKRDLDNFISSASQMLEKSRKQIAQLVGDVENNQVPRSVGHTDQLLRTIDNVSNLFLSMSSFVEVYQPRQPWKSLYSSIPNFIDSIPKA